MDQVKLERFAEDVMQLNMDAASLFSPQKNWHAIASRYQDSTIAVWDDWLVIGERWSKGNLIEIGWASHQSAVGASLVFFDDVRKIVSEVESTQGTPWRALAETVEATFGYTYSDRVHEKIKWGIVAERDAAIETVSGSRVDEVCRRLSGNGPAIYRFLASHPEGVTFSEFQNYRDPTTGRRLTESDDPEAISQMLRRHSQKLSQFGMRIEAKPTENLIRLSSRK